MTDSWEEIRPGVVVLTVARRVDVSNTRALVDAVNERIAAGQTRVILDFANTEAIDSTALGALVQIFKMLQGAGGKLVLAEVGEAIRRLLSITRLESVFTLAASREAAVLGVG